MITRRALFAATMAGAAFSADRAAACTTARRVFRPNAAERSRMLARASRLRSQFNRGAFEALVGPERVSLTLQLYDRMFQGDRRVPALREWQARYGRILTPVTEENSLVWPEDAMLSFVASMELHGTEEEQLGWGLFCGPFGGHVQLMFKLSFAIDRRSGRMTDALENLSIR
jgi:hypothetical protein